MSGSEDQVPPMGLDFGPVEDLGDAELVEHKRELEEVLYDGYAPHIHDWHEDVHERHGDVWREIRDRADTEPPSARIVVAGAGGSLPVTRFTARVAATRRGQRWRSRFTAPGAPS